VTIASGAESTEDRANLPEPDSIWQLGGGLGLRALLQRRRTRRTQVRRARR